MSGVGDDGFNHGVRSAGFMGMRVPRLITRGMMTFDELAQLRAGGPVLLY